MEIRKVTSWGERPVAERVMRKTKKIYTAGTLTYTKLGLVSLFGWLLWGDFIFNLMEIVAGSFIPLKLKALDAPNWLIGLALTTVPAFVGMTVHPVISVASDRTRTRWGRRIPFLLGATPFVTLTLVLIGSSDWIAGWLQSAFWSGMTPAQVTLWLLAFLVIAFQFLNTFITSCYIYLFNDVVPPELLSRFMALFRIVGIVATSGFQYFLFGKSETHMPEIFIGSAVLYGVFFVVMCLRVKEGEYPPPEVVEGSGWERVWGNIRTYVVECYSYRFYWWIILGSILWGVSFAMISFRVFFAESVGLSLDQFGKLMGVAGVVSAFVLYPAAALADRWHPIRVILIGLVGLLLVVPMQLVFLFFDIPPDQARVIYMVLFVLHISVQAFYHAAQAPLSMRLFPRERFGQFNTAGAIIAGPIMMLAGLLVGVWLDWLDSRMEEPLSQYRFYPAWVAACQFLCLIFMLLLYRDWKKLGGDESYRPPGDNTSGQP
ncbi:MAG: MFS transporter [Chthoniobacterales bacterium]|nr:MFS transporter [Chthoniobacterales bacterium]